MARSLRFAALPLATALLPAALAAQTPTPTVTPDPACPAVLDLAWDFSALPGANGAAWEMKDGPFASPDQPDPDRIDGGQVAVAGSVTVDLRDHGPVLDGTAWHVRVLPRPASAGVPSEAVVHDLAVSLQDAFDPFGGGTSFDWTLPAEVAGCADRVRWEFVAADGTVVDSSVETGSIATGQGSVADPPAGDYEARFAAFHGGTSPDDAVGVEAVEAVTIEGPPPMAVTVTVTDVAAAACAAGAPAGGATVTATGDGPPQTATTGADGTAGLTLPAGVWQIVATRSDCGTSAAGQVAGTGGALSVDLELPACEQPFDLAVALGLGETAEAPVSAPVVVTNAGTGPAPAGEVDLFRSEDDGREPDLGGSTRIDSAGSAVAVGSFDALCPGESAELLLLDKESETGPWIYLARLAGPGGTSARNDEESRAVLVTDKGSVAFAPPIPDVDLDPSVSQTATTIPAGGRQTYTVTVANEGKGSASGVSLSSRLSENLDYVSSSGTGGFACSRSGFDVHCAGASIAAGSSATVTIVTDLPAGAAAGHDVLFSSEADPADAIDEIDEGNNAVAAAATTGPAPPSETYAVTSVMELIEFASEKYAVERLDVILGRGVAPDLYDELACPFSTVDAPALPVFSADGGELSVSVECLWGVLTGPPLAPGWEIDFVKVTQTELKGVSGSCVLESAASDGSGIRLRVIKPAGLAPAIFAYTPGRFNTCYINEIRLTGPAGGNWKDAFQ